MSRKRACSASCLFAYKISLSSCFCSLRCRQVTTSRCLGCWPCIRDRDQRCISRSLATVVAWSRSAEVDKFFWRCADTSPWCQGSTLGQLREAKISPGVPSGSGKGPQPCTIANNNCTSPCASPVPLTRCPCTWEIRINRVTSDMAVHRVRGWWSTQNHHPSSTGRGRDECPRGRTQPQSHRVRDWWSSQNHHRFTVILYDESRWILLGDDTGNVSVFGAMLGSTVITCSCVSDPRW